MLPGGFCYVSPLAAGPFFHVIHQRSDRSEAIIYPFVDSARAATGLARELNLELAEKLGSKTADELRRLARQMMREDGETLWPTCRTA
jgi:hypothetical protein